MKFILCHEFCKGGLVSAILSDGNVSQSLCPEAFCILHQGVDLLTRHGSLPVSVDTAHGTACFQSIFKYGKFAAADHIGHILQFHAKTQIRLIGAESVHRLAPCHSRNRKLQIEITDFLK